jgi:hypothetical protein
MPGWGMEATPMVILSYKEQANEPIYIETLISEARNNKTIPNGKLPGWFKVKPVAQLLSRGNCRLVVIDNGPIAPVKTANLISCAAVIYFSKQNARAWVYHANVGEILPAHVERAFTELGKPNAANVLVVYAQPRWEEDYEDTMKPILDVGVMEDNVLIIPKISEPGSFGIDNRGNIGQ